MPKVMRTGSTGPPVARTGSAPSFTARGSEAPRVSPRLTEQQVTGQDPAGPMCGGFWDRTKPSLQPPKSLACCIIHKPDIPPGVNIQEEHFKSTFLL